MLSRILEEFRKSDKPLDLKELSRRLGIERSALEGMLDLLVRQGKLRKLCPDIKACAHCPQHPSCASASAGDLLGKVYELVE